MHCLSFRLGRKWLDIPDRLGILIDTAIAREEAHAGDAGNALREPFLLVAVRLINQLLRLDVRGEVIGDKVVVAVLDDAVDECREGLCVAECAISDSFEDTIKLWLDLIGGIQVLVAQLLNLLSKVTKEEDIVLADFSGDFNLYVSCQLFVSGNRFDKHLR